MTDFDIQTFELSWLIFCHSFKEDYDLFIHNMSLYGYLNRRWFMLNMYISCVNFFLLFVVILGWHNRLNTAAKHGGVPMYVLIPDLHQEADLVDISVRSEDLERDVHRKYSALEQKLQTAWDQYMDHSISTTHFLKTVSKLYRPTINKKQVDAASAADEPAVL